MTSLADLEAAVQRRPDPETLAVYGDALQAVGDPRGELIAIDLELDRLPDDDRTVELIARKRELLAGWLGDKVGQQPWHPREIRYGVFRGLGIAATSTQSLADYLATVLDSPLGNRHDALSIYGSRADLTRALELLAARGMPWLRTLSLQRYESDQRATKKPIDKATWDAFVDAAPHLEELTLIGTAIVASPAPPNVHTLRLPSGRGMAISRPSPAVTTIDLGFQEPFSSQPTTVARAAELISVINPRAFPGLRTLDLSRNEGAPYVTGETVLGAAINRIEDLDRFERLRMPSVPDEAWAQYLVGLADQCVGMTIEIARMYTVLDGFAHERILVPAPRPWPPSPHSREALTIHGDDLALSSLVSALEDQFDHMRPAAQEAWIAFWDFLDDLSWEDDKGNNVSKPFPVATLLRALDALAGDSRADALAATLRSEKLAPGAEVAVERYWGW